MKIITYSSFMMPDWYLFWFLQTYYRFNIDAYYRGGPLREKYADHTSFFKTLKAKHHQRKVNDIEKHSFQQLHIKYKRHLNINLTLQ